jgi:hypothetical protein
MKFEWTLLDLSSAESPDKVPAFGSLVDSHMFPGPYLIGYQTTGAQPRLISLDDGMIIGSFNTKEEFIAYLNTGEYYPLVRPRRMKLP